MPTIADQYNPHTRDSNLTFFGPPDEDGDGDESPGEEAPGDADDGEEDAGDAAPEEEG